MKTPFFQLMALGLGIVPMVGCAVFHGDKSDLVFSPDGRWVATYDTRYAGIVVPPEGEMLAYKNVGIAIRDTAGHVKQRFRYGSAGDSNGVGINEVAWSPNGTWVAVNGSKGLEVFNRADGSRKYLAGQVKRLRWVSDSEIVCITGNITVSRVPVYGDGWQVAITRRLGVLDEWHNALSPDGKTVIFQQADHLFFVNLSNTNDARQIRVEGTLFDCLWDSPGERCLFETLRSPSSSTNYYERPKILSWLYEGASGSVMNLNERLPDLPGDEEFDRPLALSPHGRWVLLPSSGGWNSRQYNNRCWLLQISPWALADLSDTVGPSFTAGSFAPHGDYLLLTTPNRRMEGRFDIFISRLEVSSGGAPVVTKPWRVAEDQFRWAWYPDGKRLLVSDGVRYQTVEVALP